MICNEQNTSIFVAIDGDDVGVKLRERIVANDIRGASLLSSAIIEYFQVLHAMLEVNDYQIAFCGGDSLLAINGHAPSFSWLEEVPVGPCTISVGIGETPEYAYLALQLAKARGKNRAVHLNRTTAETIYAWTSSRN